MNKWLVRFKVHLPSDFGGCGDTFIKGITVRANEAQRAADKARNQLMKWLDKEYHVFIDRFEIVTLTAERI